MGQPPVALAVGHVDAVAYPVVQSTERADRMDAISRRDIVDIEASKRIFRVHEIRSGPTFLLLRC